MDPSCAYLPFLIYFTEVELRSYSQDTEGWNEVPGFFDHIDFPKKKKKKEKAEDAH